MNTQGLVGGTVASKLVRSSLDRVVREEPLPGTWCCVLGQDGYSHSASPLHPGV